MRPSKIVRAVNWWHAAGELLLIVVGILIALAISDWNDRRIEQKQEHALLNEVRSALATDLETLEANLTELSQAADRIEMLSDVLEERAPYRDSMDQLFGAVYGFRTANLNTAAYETLKSVGLQSVSNRELRLRIARVFDHYYENMISEHALDVSITVDLMRPYYLKHFRDLRFSESATPIDYDFIVNDTYFQNIVEYRLSVLRANQIDSYAKAIDEIRVVLGMLAKELSHS